MKLIYVWIEDSFDTTLDMSYGALRNLPPPPTRPLRYQDNDGSERVNFNNKLQATRY